MSEIKRIQSLLSLAQHPNTPQSEAETALAMASKLMQKHGLLPDDISRGTADSDNDTQVVVERVKVGGKYRVRRGHLLYSIANIHSCVGYRDDDEGNEAVFVLYGRPHDILAAKTLYAAADALATRCIPRGDRSWKVAWWKGYQRGIEEALASAKKEFVAESPGSGLVLADRRSRAQQEMRATAPPLRGSYTYVDTADVAFQKGQDAGRRFSNGKRSFTAGVFGELQ